MESLQEYEHDFFIGFRLRLDLVSVCRWPGMYSFIYRVLSVKISMTNFLHLLSNSSTVVGRSIRFSSVHTYSKWAAVSRRRQQNRQTLMFFLNLALGYLNGPWLVMNQIDSLRLIWFISLLSNGGEYSPDASLCSSRCRVLIHFFSSKSLARHSS